MSATRRAPRDAGHRPELDGIRAVSMLAIAAFHAHQFALIPKIARGGWLGPDIFFVLSGYLITGIILRELRDTGRIAKGRFFARRARRLLPALFLLLITVAIVASQQDVADLSARRSDLLGTLGYYANWHFLHADQNYFAAQAGASPLRHTWTLAIEEQYYLVWPFLAGVFLVTLRRSRRVLAWACAAGAIASAATMAVVFSPDHPLRAYYGTDARAQSILVGACLAALLDDPPAWLSRGAWRWASVAAGAGVVIALATVPDSTSAYYRGGSLVFVIVVAVTIAGMATDPGGPAARALALRPLPWLGRISYGWYLWHWPVALWLAHKAPDSLDVRVWGLFLIALPVVIAAASYTFVEHPIRSGRIPWLRHSVRRLIGGAVAATLLTGAVAVAATDPSFLGNDPIVAAALKDRSDYACPGGSPHVGQISWCVRVAARRRGAVPVIAVTGDSTGRALDPGLVRVARTRGWGYIAAGEGGCSALGIGYRSITSAEALTEDACQRDLPGLQRAVTAQADPDLWIVADRSTQAALDHPASHLARGPNLRAAKRAFRQMIARLRASGAQVVVLETPQVGPPPDCRVSATVPGCAIGPDPTNTAVNAFWRREVRVSGPGVSLVSVNDILCPQQRCPVHIDGEIARFDGLHYTGSFSRHLGPILMRRIDAALAPQGGLSALAARRLSSAGRQPAARRGSTGSARESSSTRRK